MLTIFVTSFNIMQPLLSSSRSVERKNRQQYKHNCSSLSKNSIEFSIQETIILLLQVDTYFNVLVPFERLMIKTIKKVFSFFHAFNVHFFLKVSLFCYFQNFLVHVFEKRNAENSPNDHYLLLNLLNFQMTPKS